MNLSERLPSTRWREWVLPSLQGRVRALFLVGLFILALLPRLQAPGDFVTVDEIIHWFKRSEKFLAALQQGSYADTNMTGHPGVTTMWLGTLGIQAHSLLVDVGLATTTPDRFYNPDKTMDELYIYNGFYRGMLRLPVAIVTSLTIVLAYALLARLFDQRVALLAVLLWAVDPFLVAHSQLLHVDALLTSFVTLSILIALVAFRFDSEVEQQSMPAAATSAPSAAGWLRWRWLVMSAVVGGLAFATKSPAIVLLPTMGVIALIGLVRSIAVQSHETHDSATLLRKSVVVLPRLVLVLLAWCGVAAVVWVVLWPAAWVAPGDAVMRVVREVIQNGAQPHSGGNFFLGRPVDDPDARFYPVALALRLTPWAMVGIVAAALTIVGRRDAWQGRMSVGVLLVFALLFLLMMTIASKKHDRYLLPVFPVLNVIAALGWLRLFDLIVGDRVNATGDTMRRSVATVGSLLLLVVGIINLAWYHPYELAYYNPLVGGGPAAARAIVVGWGEGSEQVGAYISAQPDGCEKPVATWYAWVLVPYVCDDVMPMEWITIPDMTDYAVMYINQIQRERGSQTYALLRDVPPVHTVHIHGIDYAYIYQLVPERAHTLDASFGPSLYLDSYNVDTSTIASEGYLNLFVQWQARGTIDENYLLFVHVLNADGQKVGQVDVPPAGPDVPTSTWQPGRYAIFTHRVPVVSDLPAGQYWIALGVYHPQEGTRLPLRGGPSPTPQAPQAGQDALLLSPFTIE